MSLICADVINGAANLAFTLGQFNESIKLIHRAIETDPAKAVYYSSLGIFTRYAKLYNESITALRKCLELNPQFPGVHGTIGLNYLWKGKPDSAFTEIQNEKDSMAQSGGLAIVYYALGKKKEADEKLYEFIKDYQRVQACFIAGIYALREDKDKAFEWLERAYRQRDAGLTVIIGNPMLRNIVKDPRYAAFMKKMKLPIKG